MMKRGRRLRSSEAMRRLVREHGVTTDDLLYPMFVTEEKQSREIASMPGIFRYTVDDLCRAVEEVAELDIPAIMLFGIPSEKDEVGSGGYHAQGIVPQAIRAVRRAVGDKLLIVPDVCLCEYTSHGHCGIWKCGTAFIRLPTTRRLNFWPAPPSLTRKRARILSPLPI